MVYTTLLFISIYIEMYGIHHYPVQLYGIYIWHRTLTCLSPWGYVIYNTTLFISMGICHIQHYPVHLYGEVWYTTLPCSSLWRCMVYNTTLFTSMEMYGIQHYPVRLYGDIWHRTLLVYLHGDMPYTTLHCSSLYRCVIHTRPDCIWHINPLSGFTSIEMPLSCCI